MNNNSNQYNDVLNDLMNLEKESDGLMRELIK